MTQHDVNRALQDHKSWVERPAGGGRRADLRAADLRNMNLSGADLRWADFRAADLRGCNLSDADCRHADFRGANLQGAVCHRTSFVNAKMQGASLDGIDLRGADMQWSDLGGASLKSTYQSAKGGQVGLDDVRKAGEQALSRTGDQRTKERVRDGGR